jgi:hypothetical protein
MPWAGASYARAAAEDCKDAAILVKLASKNAAFYGTDAKAQWAGVVDLAAQRLALVIEEAVLIPGFQDIAANTLGSIIECIDDGEWAQEEWLHVMQSLCGEQESAVNPHGFFLRVSELPHRCVEGYVYMSEPCVSHHFLSLGDARTLTITLEVTATQNSGQKYSFTEADFAFEVSSTYAVPIQFSTPAGSDTISWSMKTRLTKIHRRCLALAGFYAHATGTALETVQLQHAWRHAVSCGVPNSTEAFVQLFSRGFSIMKLHHFHVFHASELERIISQDSLKTKNKNGEITVLKVVIGWARNKSQAYNVGDEVRVKPDEADLSMTDWAESDCVVKSVSNAGSDTFVLVERGKGEEREFSSAQLRDPGETGFLRMLPHVRCGYLKAVELRTGLSNEDIFYASKFECYRKTVKNLVQQRSGRRVGYIYEEHGKPREGYPAPLTQEDVGSAMVQMLTHADQPYVCGDPEDERTKEFLMCKCVQKFISQRVHEALGMMASKS